MKTNLKALLVVVLILFLSQIGFAKDAAQKEPAARLINPTYKFQSITEGIEVIHDFKIKNEGEAPLDILKVKPG